jgi:predicted TIM-barrel fold metal-dependent hydrolase
VASPDRIDVHQHLVPPVWAAGLVDHGGDPSGWRSPDWTPDSAMDFMDGQHIRKGILSLTAPGVSGWHGAERRNMARRVNEYGADLAARNSDRFGSFSTLPLPDIDGALIELAHALDVLKADGVILLSNYEGHYLGDPLFEPLWAELDRRAATVFVHPGKPAIPTIDGIPGPIVDYPFDTTRAAVQLVLNGIIPRFSRVRVILSHGGGFLPYAALRFAELASAVRPEKPRVADVMDAFRSFYFDTALSAGPSVLPSLLAFAKPGHVLYGSDFPYALAAVGASFTAQLDNYAGLSPETLSVINNGNARALFAAAIA